MSPDRIPLHCFATSISSAGRDRTNPLFRTGTPAQRKSMLVSSDEATWRATMHLSTRNRGVGTSKNRNSRGNNNCLAAGTPKNSVTSPIQDTTRPAMPTANAVSLATSIWDCATSQSTNATKTIVRPGNDDNRGLTPFARLSSSAKDTLTGNTRRT